MIEKIIRADGVVVSLADVGVALEAAGIRCIEAGWLAGVTNDGEIINKDLLPTATGRFFDRPEQQQGGPEQQQGEPEQQQGEPEQPGGPEQQQGEPEQQPGPTEDEIKTKAVNSLKVIEQHAKRLPAELKTRQQIIAAADKFVDWIKVDLSKALDCKVVEVPAKLADRMGFSWNEPHETAAEEENIEK